MNGVAVDVPAIAGALSDGTVRELIGAGDVEVVDVTHDSRQVSTGWLFACVVGEHLDGHRFAADAIDRGATALLVERPLQVDVAQIVVADVRRAMGFAAAAVHGHPAERLRMVGVTGTNGKTTTTRLLAGILQGTGVETRELGTLTGVRTTPEAPDLQRQLAGFVRDGVDAVVMEVSSHALELHRTAGSQYDVAVFTNLGRDHLDLHGTMEAYFRAKAALFRPDLSRRGVVCVDDAYGRLLIDAAEIPIAPFGIDDADSIDVRVDELRFDWRGRHVTVPVGGRFNILNALAALTAAGELGVDVDDAIAALAGAAPVPGRFEVVSDPGRDDIAVVVDYAVTPDSLAALLEAARSVAGAPDHDGSGRDDGSAAGRVVVVFGCGGDRDVEKRPLMGAAASTHADVVVLTSDNPRSEDPRAIIDAALAGVEARYRDDVLIEVDRRRAIAVAIASARPGDVVVVAGKGHETTQTIGDHVLPFDDRVVARELLARRAAGDPT